MGIRKENRRLCERHPDAGKEKVHVLLALWCAKCGVSCPGVRTIGWLIADAPDKMRKVAVRLDSRKEFKRWRRQRLGKGFRAGYTGHCMAFDTVVCFAQIGLAGERESKRWTISIKHYPEA